MNRRRFLQLLAAVCVAPVARVLRSPQVLAEPAPAAGIVGIVTQPIEAGQYGFVQMAGLTFKGKPIVWDNEHTYDATRYFMLNPRWPNWRGRWSSAPPRDRRSWGILVSRLEAK